VMAFYGQRGIPVELNEPHHWGMRDAHDAVFVVSAFLSAYNARAFGVRDYIAQFMFNSPPGHSDAMDLAKMLAVLELVEPLAGPEFPGVEADPHRTSQLPTRSRMLPEPIWHPASIFRWLCGLISSMSSGTLKPIMPLTPEDVIEACKLRSSLS
jgi:hypothetical protein